MGSKASGQPLGTGNCHERPAYGCGGTGVLAPFTCGVFSVAGQCPIIGPHPGSQGLGSLSGLVPATRSIIKYQHD